MTAITGSHFADTSVSAFPSLLVVGTHCDGASLTPKPTREHLVTRTYLVLIITTTTLSNAETMEEIAVVVEADRIFTLTACPLTLI